MTAMLAPPLFGLFDHGDDFVEVAAGEPVVMAADAGRVVEKFSDDGGAIAGPQPRAASYDALPHVKLVVGAVDFAVVDVSRLFKCGLEPRPTAFEAIQRRIVGHCLAAALG